MNKNKSPWISSIRNDDVNYRLFCFPFAGAGSNVYRSWISDLSPEIDVCPIQLPGRENRMNEKAIDNVHDMASQIATEIEPYTDVPFAFFGHCIGALIAYELVVTMQKLNMNTPDHIYLSAFRSPEYTNPNRELYQLDDAEFKSEIKEYGGFSDYILNNDEIMKTIMPMLRADFALHENYRYPGNESVECPISLLCGDQDHIVKKEHMQNWSNVSNHDVNLTMISGGHFFINERKEDILNLIRTRANQLCAA